MLRFRDVDLVRDGRHILRGIDLEVGSGERWILLGPNGAGKSSVVRLAATCELPTSGEIHVLGHRVGAVDLRRVVRPRIGLVAPDLERGIVPGSRALDAVAMGLDASLRRWRRDHTEDQRARARELLETLGCGALAGARFGRLSDGERRRVLVARALMPDPPLLLLDEPCANLDLGGREQVIRLLEQLASSPRTGAIVLVTHHLEEIPPSATHAALVRDGSVFAAGPIRDVLDSRSVSGCFGTRVEVRYDSSGRWRVTGARSSWSGPDPSR